MFSGYPVMTDTCGRKNLAGSSPILTVFHLYLIFWHTVRGTKIGQWDSRTKLNMGGRKWPLSLTSCFLILKLQLHMSFGHMNIHVKHWSRWQTLLPNPTRSWGSGKDETDFWVTEKSMIYETWKLIHPSLRHLKPLCFIGLQLFFMGYDKNE